MFKSVHSSSPVSRDGALSTPYASRPFRAKLSTDYPGTQHRNMLRRQEYYSLSDPHLIHYFRAKLLSGLDRSQYRTLSSLSYRTQKAGSISRLSFASSHASSQSNSQERVYKVIVKTGLAPNSGTTARAYVTLQGSKGKLKRRRLIKSGKKDFLFCPGKSDRFRIRGRDVGSLTHVTIESDGLKERDSWFVESITVVNEDGERWFCPCNQWLSLFHTDCQLSRTLRAKVHKHKSSDIDFVDYQLEIYTGDVRGGGTGANVFITLWGTKNSSSKQQIWGGFDRGSVVKARLQCPADLGQINKLIIGHDNSGFGADWFLDQVILYSLTDPWNKMYFKCRQWLSRTQGDGLIERSLPVSKEPLNKPSNKLYLVSTITGNMRGAGTNANIFITLFGEKGTSGERRLDNDPSNFERGRKDTFSIHCSDLGTLTQVVIRHDNSGVGPSWYLEGVEVVDRKEKGDQKTKFPCGRWLEMCDGCGGVLKVELLPEAVAGKIEKKGGDVKYSYKVTVRTGERRGGGTSANVYLILCGRDGNSGKLKLENEHRTFLPGQTDRFEVESSRLVSPLESVVIGHDNANTSPGWFLAEVKVECVSTGRQWTFPCKQWLCMDTGDGRIERELHPIDQDCTHSSHTWEIHVFTSNLRDAGTDANVTLKIHGTNTSSYPIPLGGNIANFEQGECDIFNEIIIPTKIGKVEAITVSHDGTNPYPEWHLEKVILKNVTLREEYQFHCGRWLSADNANSVRLTANPSLTPPSTPLNTVRSRDKGDESLSHAQSSNSEDSSITNQYLQQLRYDQTPDDSHASQQPSLLNTQDVSPLQTNKEETIPYTVNIMGEVPPVSAPVLELILCGDDRCSLPITLEPLGTRPATANLDTYSVEGTNVGNITSIKVRMIGENSAGPWLISQITIHSPTTGHTHHFPCGHGITPEEGELVLKVADVLDSSFNTSTMVSTPRNPTSDLIAYEVRVLTADKKNAGTRNSLYLMIVGDNKSSKVFTLKNSSRKPKLQRGQTDSFQVATFPLGTLNSVRVAHCPRRKHMDSEEENDDLSSWYLFKIVLIRLEDRTKFDFLCRQWIESSSLPSQLNFTEIHLSK